MSNKLKVGFLSPISQEWFHLHTDKIELCQNIAECDYIIFESNGDPVGLIMKIKSHYPKNKLVFILSGDQSGHIDDECIWFSNAVKPSGLAAKQTQIFVSNPAIFKFYDRYSILANIRSISSSIGSSIGSIDDDITKRGVDIYFKGTIWAGMRENMYRQFVDKPGCVIIANNNYWQWRLNGHRKPIQLELEEVAYESYRDMVKAKLVLCPKGNGNSSMRILEALGCGAIPVLINDSSAPFGKKWDSMGDAIALVFNTETDSWDKIYQECQILLNDPARMQFMIEKGKNYFRNVIYGDYANREPSPYKDINTVCYGFSGLIINKLIEYSKTR